MKPEELAQFKKLLLRRHALLSGNVTAMENQALKRSRQANSGDLSNMPIHMADIGTDNFEQEFTLGLIENEDQMLRDIEDALARIENGTYGLCENCGKPIRKVRLKALPSARYCIECQRLVEEGLE